MASEATPSPSLWGSYFTSLAVPSVHVFRCPMANCPNTSFGAYKQFFV